MERQSPADLARALYAALAAGDREQLDALLHPEFTGARPRACVRTSAAIMTDPRRCGATAGARSLGISRHAPSRNNFSTSPMAVCW